MGVQIEVYQSLLKGRGDRLCQGFRPLHWPVRPDGILREAVLHDHLFRTVAMAPATLYGLVSSRFFEKTHLELIDIEKFVVDHPGGDVYLFNPFPQARFYTFNVWDQGEACHPGLIRIANRLLKDLGYGIDVSRIGRHNRQHTCYCNFWIGTMRFWERFMEFVQPLYEYASRNLGKGPLFETARYHEPAVFFPFIYERMLTTFLSLEPDIRAVAYEPPRVEMKRNCVTPVDRLIVDLFGDVVDRWDEDARIDARHRRLFGAAHRTQRAIEGALGLFG